MDFLAAFTLLLLLFFLAYAIGALVSLKKRDELEDKKGTRIFITAIIVVLSVALATQTLSLVDRFIYDIPSPFSRERAREGLPEKTKTEAPPLVEAKDKRKTMTEASKEHREELDAWEPGNE